MKETGILINETVLKHIEEVRQYKHAKGTNIWITCDGKRAFHIVPSKKFPDMFMAEHKMILESEGRDKYLFVNIKSSRFLAHRLVALAWVPIPERFEKLLGENWVYEDLNKNKIIINHIDGTKSNNHYSNLEWVTYKENSAHAIRTGLTKDNISGMAYDVVKNEEFEFLSLQHLRRLTYVAADVSSLYLKSKRDTLLVDRYMLRRTDEENYPFQLSKDDIWKSNNSNFRALEITDTKTGKQEDVYALKEAVKKFDGFSYEEIVRKVKQCMFKTKDSVIKVKNFAIKPISDYDRIKPLRERYYAIKRKQYNPENMLPKQFPVIAKLDTGDMLYFNNRKEAAKHFNANDSVLKYCLNTRNGRWKNVLFEYVKDEPQSSQASNP